MCYSSLAGLLSLRLHFARPSARSTPRFASSFLLFPRAPLINLPALHVLTPVKTCTHFGGCPIHLPLPHWPPLSGAMVRLFAQCGKEEQFKAVVLKTAADPTGALVDLEFGDEFGKGMGLPSCLELCASHLGSRIRSVKIGHEESGYPAGYVSEAQWISFFIASPNIIAISLTSVRVHTYTHIGTFLNSHTHKQHKHQQ
jgi:hypothetical protein